MFSAGRCFPSLLVRVKTLGVLGTKSTLCRPPTCQAALVEFVGFRLSGRACLWSTALSNSECTPPDRAANATHVFFFSSLAGHKDTCEAGAERVTHVFRVRTRSRRLTLQSVRYSPSARVR